jgi:hypothetical protein
MYVFFLCEIQLQRAIFYITSNNDPNGCLKPAFLKVPYLSIFLEKTFCFAGNIFSYGIVLIFFISNHHSSCP